MTHKKGYIAILERGTTLIEVPPRRAGIGDSMTNWPPRDLYTNNKIMKALHSLAERHWQGI